MRPSVNLRDDVYLKSMKLFKQSMQRYAVYIRKDIDLTPDLYYDIFINLCEPEMKKKLGGITGIREMGESKIWEVVEEIFMDTNPVYIRRVRAMNLQKEKGETTGDFFNRLREEYAEVEMEKATPWTLFICKLINGIQSSENDLRVKEQLLDTYRLNPNPQEKDLEKFQTVIKQNEALITARDFKGGEGGALRRVTEDLPKQEGRLHFLCNKVHKKRECKQQCGGFKMFGSHLEQTKGQQSLKRQRKRRVEKGRDQKVRIRRKQGHKTKGEEIHQPHLELLEGLMKDN